MVLAVEKVRWTKADPHKSWSSWKRRFRRQRIRKFGYRFSWMYCNRDLSERLSENTLFSLPFQRHSWRTNHYLNENLDKFKKQKFIPHYWFSRCSLWFIRLIADPFLSHIMPSYLSCRILRPVKHFSIFCPIVLPINIVSSESIKNSLA